MKLACLTMILFIMAISCISCSTKVGVVQVPIGTGVNKAKAILCPLEEDNNLKFTSKVKNMINKSNYFQVDIDDFKTSKILFDLWSDGDYEGVGKMASNWFAHTDAEILFYGRHINSHTFFLGYLHRSSGYSASPSIIQIDELNYNPKGYPTPGFQNKLKRIWNEIP